MVQSHEIMKMCSLMLYQYYECYRKTNRDLNRQLLDMFTLYLMRSFQSKFPWFDMEEQQLTNFLLLQDPFQEMLDLKTDPNLFSNMWSKLTQFVHEHYYVIDNDYVILEIVPIPIDSLAITHGMIVGFFTPYLE